MYRKRVKKAKPPRWENDVYRDLPSTPGIYIIWFEGLFRAYIGHSNNIHNRVRTHLYEMQAYRDHKMRADLQRMGKQSVRAAVLEVVSDLSVLPKTETYWLNQYLTGGWELYNVEKVGKVHRDRWGLQ